MGAGAVGGGGSVRYATNDAHEEHDEHTENVIEYEDSETQEYPLGGAIALKNALVRTADYPTSSQVELISKLEVHVMPALVTKTKKMI